MTSPAIPTAIHKKRGTYNSTKHGNRVDNVIEFDDGLQFVHELEGDALLMRDHLVSVIPAEILKTCDSTVLMLACETWARYRDLKSMWEADKENKKVFQMMRACSIDFRQIAVKFCMSPVDRARLTVAGSEKKVNDNLSKLLANHITGNRIES